MNPVAMCALERVKSAGAPVFGTGVA